MAYFTEDGRLQIGRRLFACRACGFLSTRGPEFTTRNGVILNRDCAEAADMGLEPIAGWVAEAIAAEERRSKAVPTP